MDQNCLEKSLTAIEDKYRLLEANFWLLSKVEDHTAEQELQMARELLILQRDKELVQQLIDLAKQQPTQEVIFPLKHALSLCENECAVIFQDWVIQDNSESFVIKPDQITDDQVKGFLIIKYDEKNSQQSDQSWEDQSSQNEEQMVFEVEDKDMQELEEMVDKHEQAIYDEPKYSIKLHKDTICCFAQNPIERDQFATASCDDSFKVTKLTTQTTIFQHDNLGETVSLVDYSFDGKLLAVALVSGLIIIYSEKKEIKLEQSSEPTVLKWHPKGNALLAAFEDSNIWLWNGISGEVMNVFAGHEAQVTCGGFSLNGKQILSGSSDASFRIWNGQTAQQLTKYSGHNFHKEEVICFTQHHDLPLVATGSSDKTICIINLANGKPLGQSELLANSIVEVCFAVSNQPVVLAGDQSGNIYIFNFNQMRVVDKLSICTASITKILFKESQFYISALDGKIVTLDHRQTANYKIIQAQSGVYDMIVDTFIVVGCENGCVYVY